MGINKLVCKLFKKDKVTMIDVIAPSMFIIGCYGIYLWESGKLFILDNIIWCIVLSGCMTVTIVISIFFAMVLIAGLVNRFMAITLFESKRR